MDSHSIHGKSQTPWFKTSTLALTVHAIPGQQSLYLWNFTIYAIDFFYPKYKALPKQSRCLASTATKFRIVTRQEAVKLSTRLENLHRDAKILLLLGIALVFILRISWSLSIRLIADFICIQFLKRTDDWFLFFLFECIQKRFAPNSLFTPPSLVSSAWGFLQLQRNRKRLRGKWVSDLIKHKDWDSLLVDKKFPLFYMPDCNSLNAGGLKNHQPAALIKKSL